MDSNNGPLTPPQERYEKTVTPGKDENEVTKKGRCMRPTALGKTLIGVGVFLVLFGILYGTVLPKVIDDKVNDGVVTCNAKDGAKTKYVDAYGDCDECTPYYYNLYMFNVTNAEVHLATNAKLQLQEVGPYAFRRRQIRVDVSFDDNNRVSFKQYTYHTFDPSMSCEGCSDQDKVIGYNVGYLSTIAQAGGERAFLTRLARGSFARTNNTGLDETIRTNGAQMMRWVNGLNSFDPVALQTVSPRVLNFLLTGPAAIQDLVLEGFAYNGIFATRTISQWALGYPSMLAGIGLASNYNNVCVTGGMNDRCAACVGNEATPECLQIWNECRKCTSGARVLALNNVTCGQLTNIYAAAYGAEAAATWASGTCGLCSSSIPLCAAPLPGIAERSGLDFSQTPPASSSLRTFIMRTGCDDKDHINEYEQYDGYRATALWSPSVDPTRNPTLSEIIAFQTYGNCANPTGNFSCSPVRGSDATSLHPGGVSITGFEDTIDQETADIYVFQGFQNVTINQVQEVKYRGIKLHRFQAPNDLLTRNPTNAWLGTGTPVSGVQSLAFTSNFLAYMSYPLFIHGDRSLLDNVDLTLLNGVVAKQESLYDSNGVLHSEYDERFTTYMDVEAGTGKTMRARRRLQASYALSYSIADPTVVMSDVLWPNLTAEVIAPAYHGEESATITSKRVSSYKTIRNILRSIIPVLIIAIVLGLALAIYGVVYYRRAVAAPAKTKSTVNDV
ncbi:Croquemort-like mating, partial [Globisporangium splendens]